MIKINGRQNQRNIARSLMFMYQHILCKKLAPFSMALLQELCITCTSVREPRIVTGSTQIAAQMAEHFVT
jgi:hypothetical protein